MKKALIMALIVVFTAGPVLAGGSYRSEPGSHDSCPLGGAGCNLGNGLVWLIKLPFRLVTSTTVGIYELVTEQDLHGFVDGYELI